MLQPDVAVQRKRLPFATVPHALVDDETISPQAKAAYLVLDRYADSRDSSTFVGKDRLARKLGMKKPSSVDRYLTELRDAGWLEWHRRWKRKVVDDAGTRWEYSLEPGEGFEPATNLYVLNDEPTVSPAREQPVSPRGEQPVSANGDTGVSANGDTGISAGRDTNKNQVIKNQDNKNQTNVGLQPTSAPADQAQPLLVVEEQPAPRKRHRPNYPDDFEAWWQVFPNHRGSKKEAYGQWDKALERAPLDTIMAATRELSAYVEAGHMDAQFVKHGVRWLKYDGWESELEWPAPPETPQQYARRVFEEYRGTPSEPPSFDDGPVIDHDPWSRILEKGQG